VSTLLQIAIVYDVTFLVIQCREEFVFSYWMISRTSDKAIDRSACYEDMRTFQIYLENVFRRN